MIKRIFALLTASLFFSVVTLTAFAQEIPDTGRTDCTIEMVVRCDGQPVTGGTFTAIRVADIREDNGSYFFFRVYDDVCLSDLQSAEAARELETFVQETEKYYAFQRQTISIQDGKGTFRSLPTGLYLILQEVPAPGYSASSPFLVGVPYLEGGKYQYHVTASAKTELERQLQPTEPPPPKPSGSLPQTGQQTQPVPILAAAGVVLFTFGWVLRSGQRRK